jgi:hypothetical protein
MKLGAKINCPNKAAYSAEIASASTFKTMGLDTAVANAYLETQEGQQMLKILANADSTSDAGTIYGRAMDILSSGKNPPTLKIMTSPLVKVVPKGGSVSTYSPFFTTMDEIKTIMASDKSVAEAFGLPLKSEAIEYDVFQIIPKSPTTVFVSDIAQTEELGGLIKRSGGAKQFIVPDRNLWNSPELINTISK